MGEVRWNINGIYTILFLFFYIIGNVGKTKGFAQSNCAGKIVLHAWFYRFFLVVCFLFLRFALPLVVVFCPCTCSLSPPCFRFLHSDRCGGGGGISGSSSLSLSIGGIYEDRVVDAAGFLGWDPHVDAPSLSESSLRRLVKFRFAFTYMLGVRRSWLLHWPVKKRCIPAIVWLLLKVETSLAVPTTRSAYWLGFVSSILTTHSVFEVKTWRRLFGRVHQISSVSSSSANIVRRICFTSEDVGCSSLLVLRAFRLVKKGASVSWMARNFCFFTALLFVLPNNSKISVIVRFLAV